MMLDVHQPLELGLACLANLYRHFGLDVDAPWLKQQMVISGTLFASLGRLARQHGFLTRIFFIDAEHLPEEKAMPLLTRWQNGRPVVLLARRRRKVVVWDPAEGIKRLDFDAFRQLCDGTALQLSSPSLSPRRVVGLSNWFRFNLS